MSTTFIGSGLRPVNNVITVDPALNGDFSVDGYSILIESIGKNTSTKELTRRVTRTPTLDGGVAFYYGGFTHADRTLRIELQGATGEEAAAALDLVANNNNVHVQNSEGLFLCAVQSVAVRETAISFVFLVKEKVA